MKRLWRVGLAVFLLAGLMIPSPALAVTSTYYSSPSDGYLSLSGSNYSTVWDWGYPSSVIVSTTAAEGYIGQGYSSTYSIYRSMLYFDTSAIPDNAVISGVTLQLYGVTDASTTDFDIQIQSGQSIGFPHDTLEAGDYY